MGILKEDIKNSPQYHGLASVDTDYEEKLFKHYGLKK